jgi:hypothetical protein
MDAFGQVEKKVGSGWKKVSVGDVLPEATTIRTGAGGAALLLLLDGGHRVRIGEKTTVTLAKLGEGKNFSLQVLGGQVWSLVRKASQPASFRVETPSAVAGVTGTLFGVAVDEEGGQTVIDTDEGSVEVQGLGADAPKKRLPVRAGQYALFPKDGPKPTPTPDPGHPGKVGALPGTLAAMTFSALSHHEANRAMWKRLKAEGGWSRQDGRGPMRLARNGEEKLRRWWNNPHKRPRR